MSSQLNKNDIDIKRETGCVIFFLQIKLINTKDALESCPNNRRSSKQKNSERVDVNRPLSPNEMAQLIYYYHVDSNVFLETDIICSSFRAKFCLLEPIELDVE
jgi:hypothetical protein